MSIVLTKIELTENLYEKLQNSSKSDIKNIIETLLNIMKKAIKVDNVLLLSSFGKFETYSKNARKGRNPHTEKPMLLTARNVIVFRVSKKFRLELNDTTKE